jgi:hypothetical protein
MVAENWKRQMKSRGHFLLVRGILRAQSEQPHSQPFEIVREVAEAARLRSAPSRSGNQIPIWNQRLFPGSTGAWIREHNSASMNIRQVDRHTERAGQRNGWQPRAHEMSGPTVIERDRQISR